MVKECSVAQRHLASENGNACRKKLMCAGVAARTDFAGIIAPLGNGNGVIPFFRAVFQALAPARSRTRLNETGSSGGSAAGKAIFPAVFTQNGTRAGFFAEQPANQAKP